MGVPNLDSIFDLLDPRCCGYLTAIQIADFYETLHFTRINSEHITAAISHVCGNLSKDVVRKDHFGQVLEEVERRRQVEEQARWDFRALDHNASDRLEPKQALLLMRQTHGDRFSMATWNQFLASREQPGNDVSFDEVRMWLCSAPGGEPCDTAAVAAEQNRLTNLQHEKAEEEFSHYKTKALANGSAQQRQDYEDKTKRLARRKLNRWEEGGVESLLYDDGVDDGSDVPARVRSNLGINDILDALQGKYDGLRKKLFGEMLRHSMGDVVWSSLSESEQAEAYQQLLVEEKNLRKEKSLSANGDRLQGAAVEQDASLLGMMGNLRSDLQQHINEINHRKMAYMEDGRSESDALSSLRKECEKELRVKTPCAKILSDLDERYHGEKDFLLTVMRSAVSGAGSGAPITGEFCRLLRQQVVYDLEETFVGSASAVGLAERQHAAESFLPDRLRQESLARDRLHHRKGRKLKLPMQEEVGVKGQTPLTMQVKVIQEVTWKHAVEREVLIQMMTSKDGPSLRASAKQLDEQQRIHRLTSLRNQRTSWRKSSTEYMLSQKDTHHKLLQEGLGIYSQNRHEQLGSQASETSVSASVLADLQEKQDLEFDELLQVIPKKNVKELEESRQGELLARKHEHLDNLAAVILGTFELEESEQPFMNALKEKYDTLTQVLLMHDLRLELGLAWDRMAVEEKQRLFLKKRREEEHLRQDGHLDAMGQLTVNLPQDFLSVRALFGESRSEFQHRKRVLLGRQEQEAYSGRDFTKVESDEEPASNVKSLNPVADLVQRFYAEQDALINWLRSPEVKVMTSRERQSFLALVRMERRQAEGEEWFDMAAIAVGLQERVSAALANRDKTDMDRLNDLATRHVMLRIERLADGKTYTKQLDEYARPEKGDIPSWEDAFLKEMTKKHRDEREMLLSMLQDPSIEDLQEAARMMSEDERKKRLAELRTKRYKLALENSGDREENLSILEEAAAIHSVMAWEHWSAGPEEVSWDLVAMKLLVEVMGQQDVEVAKVIQNLHNMDENELKRAREYEINMRHWQASDNVLQALTKYEGNGEDEELLKALEDKYDALRDKLLMEALMKQMGEADWQRLSEEERQRRLMQLKLKERQLRKQGKYDELAALLGEGFANEEALRKLMGDNRSEYERKLQERLAQRQKRIEQGLDPDEEEGEGLEESEGGSAGDPLKELYDRFAQDKDALLARLHGMNDEYMSERDRQAELLRLRREKLMAEKENNFENAALLIGLAERQQADANERLKNDRLRQEQLARERLEEMRRKRDEKRNYDDNVIRSEDQAELQDAVLKRLSERQAEERALLSNLLEGCHGDEQLVAQSLSQLEREDRMNEIKMEMESLGKDDATKYRMLMQEACRLKVECRRVTLAHENEGSEVSLDDLAVSLLADLQEKQEQESAKLVDALPDKANDELITLQATYINERNKQQGKNVVALVTSPEDHGKNSEDEVLDALEGKYDTLRNKLLAEALMQQMGESNWQNLSEQERQKKLMQMKLEERRLRKEGKLDEAAALLGESIRNHESLEKLLGDNKAEQERKLKERLEKRRQRQEQGLSDEECDRLEAQDEEEEKKRRNVLLDLQHEYDKERDELLKRLQSGSDRETAERLRQLELAKLRREQRRARHEDKFDAAALVLGLAQQHDKHAEEDRLRQEQLARERLAARRANRGKASTSGAVAMPEDVADVLGLQEALLKEIELKHDAERDALIEILEAAGPGLDAAKTMDEAGRQNKLVELQALRQQWRSAGAKDTQEQMTLLKEGACLHLVITQTAMEADGKSSSEADVQVALLADLQQRQDAELQGVVDSLQDKPPEVIVDLKAAHFASRQNHWLDNTAAVVLGEAVMTAADQGLSVEEQELVQELEKKYDAVRDKLFTEALLKSVGESEWAAMSERDRQAQLVKLKLEEKRLRQEGRYDEAAALLGQLQDNDEELKKKLGDSRAEYQRKLEERLKRRQELIAARESKGLSTDEAVLDAIQEQEGEGEEEQSGENILEALQHRFDEEREALLAGLRGHDDKMAAERQRQLELALLRREQKKLQQEDKFDSAAILLSMADQQERQLKDKFESERERQRELARERLAARRRKTADDKANTSLDQSQLEDDLRQQAEEDKIQDALLATDAVHQGASVLQESLLAEVEKRQASERDMLLELLAAAQNDTKAKMHAESMTMEEVKSELDRLCQEQAQWQIRSREAAYRVKDAGDKAEKQHLADSAQLQAEQYKLLIRAAALKTRVVGEEAKKQNSTLDASAIYDEVSVILLAELQQTQLAESTALEKVILKQDETLLQKLRDSQRLAIREGWRENLNRTIFRWTEPAEDPEDQPELPDSQAVTQELEKEFELEKRELQEKGNLSGEDLDAAMKDLEAQQEAKRKALEAALVRQHEQMKKKLEARREARDRQDYEQDAAAHLIQMATEQDEALTARTSEEKGRQRDLMQERLEERRAARKRKMEEEKAKGIQETYPEARRPSMSDAAFPPSLRRERSAMSDVSDDQKQEIYSQLVRQQTNLHKKISMDQQRQQELLEKRLRERKGRRTDEAAALFSLGERQKTVLEASKQEERDRQIAAMRERVERVRYERTMTMKERANKGQKFEEVVDDKDTSGMTEDEKMALAAKRLQEKLTQEESEIKEGKRTSFTPEDEGDENGQEDATSGDVDGKQGSEKVDKMEILKQRRLQKKRDRQAKKSGADITEEAQK